jgi:hypothetical protein
MIRLAPWLGMPLLVAGVLYLGFGVDRTDFASLFIAFTLAFCGYGLVVRSATIGKLNFLIGLGLLLRFALIFGFPLLSDDVYRFVWDGRLVVAGHNPFTELPAYYLEGGREVAGLTPELYQHLNSPDYHSIYPPVAQAVFALAAWLAPGSLYGAAVGMKVFLLLAEAGTLWVMLRLLGTFALGRERVLLYWLNPLIIVEIVGNLHFEGAMIFFLLASLYLLTRGRYGAAAGAMGMSVASKLLPLMLLPFLLWRLWRRPFWVYGGVLAVTLMVTFTPLLVGSGVLSGLGSSLDLYFRKFEFNASLYYLARAYGYYEIGWNQIARFGPLLARAAAVGILLAAYLDRRTDWASLPEAWLFAFVGYLLCATTVHPWYLAVPIALCCFTRWRFPLFWSYLIMLTYTSYTTDPYRENLWLVVVEYTTVGVIAIYEWRRGK